jgi:hypothetical protein
MKDNGSLSAMPLENCNIGLEEVNESATGLTKREYFAAMAMHGCVSEIQESVPDGIFNVIKLFLRNYGLSFIKVKYRAIDGAYDDAARRCVIYSYSLIDALNKTKG